MSAREKRIRKKWEIVTEQIRDKNGTIFSYRSLNALTYVSALSHLYFSPNNSAQFSFQTRLYTQLIILRNIKNRTLATLFFRPSNARKFNGVVTLPRFNIVYRL